MQENDLKFLPEKSIDVYSYLGSRGILQKIAPEIAILIVQFVSVKFRDQRKES